jgi:hypothetical protein
VHPSAGGTAGLVFTLSPRIPEASQSDTAGVAAAEMHPAFELGAHAGSNLHDIAVLFLARPLSVAPEAWAAENGSVEQDVLVDIVGYGQTAVDGATGTRTAARSRLVAVDVAEFTAGGGGLSQGCYGDSGGPAFSVPPMNQRRLLLGITSRGRDDSPACDHGAIYTRIDAHAAWIEEALAAHTREAAGPRPGGCTVVAHPDRSGASAAYLAVLLLWGLGRRRRSGRRPPATPERLPSPMADGQARRVPPDSVGVTPLFGAAGVRASFACYDDG